MPKRNGKLTPKEELFCQEYLIDRNYYHAYVRAGYTGRGATAQTEACRLARRPPVAERLQELDAERSRRLGLMQDYVITELMKIAQAKITDVMDWSSGKILMREDLSSDAISAIAKISASKFGGIDIELHNRVDVLWKIAKLTGCLDDLNIAIMIFRRYGYLVELEDGKIKIDDTQTPAQDSI